MRRVLMLALTFPPMSSAGVFRTVRFVKYLPSVGWEPIVLTAGASGDGHTHDGPSLALIPPELTVVRTPLPPPGGAFVTRLRSGKGTRSGAPRTSGPRPSDPSRGRSVRAPSGLLHRLRTLFLQMPDVRIWWRGPARQAARRLVGTHRPTVVYSTGPPHSSHLIAGRIARDAGLPFVADLRDPWARSPWRAPLRTPLEEWLHDRLERRVVNRAAQVVLNTERLAARFRATYPTSTHKFEAIPNGFDPEQLEQVQASAASPGDPRVLRLCHPGTLHRYRDPRPLLRSLDRVARARGLTVIFQQIGFHDSAFGLDAAAAASTEGPVRVELVRWQSHADVLLAMARADCLVVLQSGTDVQVPAKLYDMLMVRRPMLTLSTPGATRDLVERYDLGERAAPDDESEITQAVGRILASRSGPPRGRWREALEQFDGRRLTAQLASCLERAVHT